MSAMFRNAITSDTTMHFNAFIYRGAKRFKSLNINFKINHFKYVTHFLSTCQPIQDRIKVLEQVFQWLKIIIISQHHRITNAINAPDPACTLQVHKQICISFPSTLKMQSVWSFIIYWYKILTIHIHASLHASPLCILKFDIMQTVNISIGTYMQKCCLFDIDCLM